MGLHCKRACGSDCTFRSRRTKFLAVSSARVRVSGNVTLLNTHFALASTVVVPRLPRGPKGEGVRQPAARFAFLGLHRRARANGKAPARWPGLFVCRSSRGGVWFIHRKGKASGDQWSRALFSFPVYAVALSARRLNRQPASVFTETP